MGHQLSDPRYVPIPTDSGDERARREMRIVNDTPLARIHHSYPLLIAFTWLEFFNHKDGGLRRNDGFVVTKLQIFVGCDNPPTFLRNRRNPLIVRCRLLEPCAMHLDGPAPQPQFSSD